MRGRGDTNTLYISSGVADAGVKGREGASEARQGEVRRSEALLGGTNGENDKLKVCFVTVWERSAIMCVVVQVCKD